MEQDSGICSVCLENLSDCSLGVRCVGCCKKYHLLCARLEVVANDFYSEWFCYCCTEMNNITCLLRSQEADLANISTLSNKVDSLSSTLKKSLRFFLGYFSQNNIKTTIKCHYM
ncbi:hypothetical protein ACFFRR_005475 [Megaselia abdita]